MSLHRTVSKTTGALEHLIYLAIPNSQIFAFVRLGLETDKPVLGALFLIYS